MNPLDLKSTIAQSYLSQKGYYKAIIDGLYWEKSKAAADTWASLDRASIVPRLSSRADQSTIKAGKGSWGFLRTIAAQILLADLKLYAGKIDGDWGPLSLAAAAMWASIYLDQPSAPDADTAAPTPYQVARGFIGVKEIPGKQHNPTILNWYRRLVISIYDDETPWCSTFINYCALEAGYERTRKLNARSWLDIGAKVPLELARPGDVIIFSRGTSNWEGHVAFIESIAGGYAKCLGGNQSNAVNVSSYSLSRLLGVRRLRSLDQLQGGSNKI